MGKQERVLIVEDDPEMVSAVSKILEGIGLSSESYADGILGLEAAIAGHYSLVILDVQLPSLDGLEICRRLRAERPQQLIIMLTTETDEISTVLGLELGADEYIAKPFRARELRARINALLRRAALSGRAHSEAEVIEQPEANFLRVGPIRIDLASKQVLIHESEYTFTPIEYALLVTFLEHPSKFFSAQELAAVAMGYENLPDYGTPVRPHISRLRKKLTHAGLPDDCILNQPGFGYRFQFRTVAENI